VGPTSWFFLGALIAGFSAALYWLVKTPHVILRITAGVLAFAVSSFFGAALVNQHYAYYTSWGSLTDDLFGNGVTGYQQELAPPPGEHGKHDNKPTGDNAPTEGPTSGAGIPSNDGSAPSAPPALAPVPASVSIGKIGVSAVRVPGSGRVVQMDLAGPRSGVVRKGYVYLPPQYFMPAYATTEFPVIELLHGDPGDPSGWIYALHVPTLMDRAINAGRIGPMVVVMPATFRGAHGQDCLDVAGGQLDDTYLASDVPNDIMNAFRVLPQGVHWAIGGLSDGGFCAANLALRHPGKYGAVASMDGFYSVDEDAATLNRLLDHNLSALRANDPSTLATDPQLTLPRFWLMSGTDDSFDVKAAARFRELVTGREQVASLAVRGGHHTPSAWRVALPSLLEWAWNTISGGPVGTQSTTLSITGGVPSAHPSL
jgi:S-formylglutathione hydrolase FrmB